MRSEFTTRVATAEDEAQVSQLLNASYPPLMKVSYDPHVLEAALPRMTGANPALLKSGTFYLVYTPDDRLVGSGGWTFDRPGTGEAVPGLAHIRHFATHPDWLRRGVGRCIFELCKDRAYSAGAREFECFASLNAVAFYESVGFKTIDEIQLPMGPDVMLPVAVMKQSLQAATLA